MEDISWEGLVEKRKGGKLKGSKSGALQKKKIADLSELMDRRSVHPIIDQPSRGNSSEVRWLRKEGREQRGQT